MKSRNLQFEYDLARIMVSLALRQPYWCCEWPLRLENGADDMAVWIGNGVAGLHFCVDSRTWGVAEPWVYRWFTPWRYRLYSRAWTTANAKCVNKYGTYWDVVGSFRELRKEMEIARAAVRAGKGSRVSIARFKQHQFGASVFMLLDKAKNNFGLQRFIRHSGKRWGWGLTVCYGWLCTAWPFAKLWGRGS